MVFHEVLLWARRLREKDAWKKKMCLKIWSMWSQMWDLWHESLNNFMFFHCSFLPGNSVTSGQSLRARQIWGNPLDCSHFLYLFVTQQWILNEGFKHFCSTLELSLCQEFESYRALTEVIGSLEGHSPWQIFSLAAEIWPFIASCRWCLSNVWRGWQWLYRHGWASERHQDVSLILLFF